MSGFLGAPFRFRSGPRPLQNKKTSRPVSLCRPGDQVMKVLRWFVGSFQMIDDFGFTWGDVLFLAILIVL